MGRMSISERYHFAPQQGFEIELNEEEEEGEAPPRYEGGRSGTMDRVGGGGSSRVPGVPHESPQPGNIAREEEARAQFILKDEHSLKGNSSSTERLYELSNFQGFDNI